MTDSPVDDEPVGLSPLPVRVVREVVRDPDRPAVVGEHGPEIVELPAGLEVRRGQTKLWAAVDRTVLFRRAILLWVADQFEETP